MYNFPQWNSAMIFIELFKGGRGGCRKLRYKGNYIFY